MPMIYITRNGAQVMLSLLDQYEGNAHPCFLPEHESICDGVSAACSACKHGKALQNLKTALFKVGYPEDPRRGEQR